MSLVKKQRTKKQSFRFFFLRLNFVWNGRKNIRKSKSVLSVLNEAFSLILLARRQAPAPRHFTNHCVMSRSEADCEKWLRLVACRNCLSRIRPHHRSTTSAMTLSFTDMLDWRLRSPYRNSCTVPQNLCFYPFLRCLSRGFVFFAVSNQPMLSVAS